MPQYFGQLPTTDQPWVTVGAVEAVSQSDRAVQLDCGESSVLISVIDANLIRVRLAPHGEFFPQRPWAVVGDEEIERSPVPFEVAETPDTVEIKTDRLRIVVQRQPCRLTCFDNCDRPFAKDAEMGMGWRMGATAAWKQIEADEHFYGFGERTGFLDKLSEVKTNWTLDALDYNSLTDEMYQAIPFFMALRPEVGYGIFFNTTFWSQFDIGTAQPGTWSMETRSLAGMQTPPLDYYIIYGPDPATILGSYTQLTGRMPLPPRWALGYHQCRWSYDSETVVRELAQEFRRRRIPCDVIHLDIDYMRGYRVFTWSPQRFPHPEKLLRELAEDGFKTITIIDPGVKYEPEANYHVFDQGIDKDYFVRKADGQLFHGYVWPDKALFPDFLRPEVRQWWGDLHESLTSIGVAGIWNDMNEPAIADRPFGDDGKHIWFPLDAPQGNSEFGIRNSELTPTTPDSSVRAGFERESIAVGGESFAKPAPTTTNYPVTTHAEVHNLYGLMMARASAEALEKLRPNERSFVLTRSGYAGVQQWSSVWMGDNQSLWEHLEMSLPMLCNMGLSGVAFAGCDIGGFAGNATAELFARWMQVGMLYPLMRGHSAMTTARHEPWVFGDRVEQICREYINLRYQLLPYIYTLFWEAATTGAPILRPLLYHFPQDPTTYNLYDQVLLGAGLMAAPIYRPGIEHRAVYIPAGTWYDWWTGEAFTGPTHILAHAPLEKMPLYVRSGTVIPMQPVVQFVDEKTCNPLTLRVWAGQGEWTMYEDDGLSFDYRQGVWSTTTYRVNTTGEETIVEIGARQGEWTPPAREVAIEVVGVGQQCFSDDGTARRLQFRGSRES
ncbi:glycoside hydrolase family 31 protein [Scytonema millei]|uniref:Glycoside hydrolase family 31 protein n=1 Tax=Scytonema millei VB511283 TaxID=1245923 RepID=A0A9X5E2U1_9CYAN|nr:glycoside hydrolase family 31 protein [Scytonema millei]NHC34166.1 glycoside hydrolase family 31 protein [Scytonema millei VB511283]